MARFGITVEGECKQLGNTEITIYTEDIGIPVGNEEGSFDSGDKHDIFSDVNMTVAEANPLLTDANGQATVYIPSGDQVAVRASKAGFGLKWTRFVDVTGTDPI